MYKVCGYGQKAKMYCDNNNADSLNVYYGRSCLFYWYERIITLAVFPSH